MSRNFFLIALLLLSFSIHAQDSILKPVSRVKSVVLKESSVNFKTKADEGLIKTDDKKDKEFDWQKNMPWIAAILIGLLTVLANYIISNQNRKLNIEVSKMELGNSKKIALAQIESIKEGMQLDFNKTVLSGNRQLWIKDFREVISLILSKTMTKTLVNNISEDEFENFKFLLIKAELMLNPNSDKALINSLSDLENCCLDILMGNKDIQELNQYNDSLRNKTQMKLESEWTKVKNAK